MARTLALTLAGAVLAFSTAAHAADLLPPAPSLEPLPPAASGEFAGWYLRGDLGITTNAGGIGLINSPDPLPGAYSTSATEAFSNSSIGAGGTFDIGAGYQFNRWLRSDLTLEYRGGSQFQSTYTLNDPVAPTSQYADFYRGNLSSFIVMANVYADLGTWMGVTPYVGDGLGYAHNTLSGVTDQGFGYSNLYAANGGGAGGYFDDGSTNNLAWALMAGLDFNVTRNLKLELGYRYLNYGKISSGGSNCLTGGGVGSATFSNANCNGGVPNYIVGTGSLTSSDFRVGLLWTLDPGPSEYAPQQQVLAPLVRKY